MGTKQIPSTTKPKNQAANQLQSEALQNEHTPETTSTENLQNKKDSIK